ncbi:MAG: MFS transporter [Candidatus Hydrogenedentota bacterium]
MSPAKREFTWVEGMAFALAYIGIQLNSETFNQWGTYFYSPTAGTGRIVYVPIGLVGVIFVIATVWDAVTDPWVGGLSDRTPREPGRWRFPRISGRRRPYIFWGSILMMFTFVGAWYPPVAGASYWNLAFGTVMLCAHFLMFTITTVPILALGPEVARSQQARVQLGIWIGIGFIVGLAIANALSGTLVTLFDTAPEGAPTSPTGYRRVAMLYAVISLVLFQLPVWLVRERFSPVLEHRLETPWFTALKQAFRNRPFVCYFVGFFMFTTGFLAVQRILAYWAEAGLGGNEGTVTTLLIPYLVVALAALPLMPKLARVLRAKWMMVLALFLLSSSLPFMYVIGAADWAHSTKVFAGGVLFGYAGLGQGILYVMITPLLGEIIDFDESRSGERREALYNGLSGVAWKASMAFSILIATQSMSIWGNSVEEPLGIYLVGPIAGGCGIVGLVVMLFYPKIEPATADAAVTDPASPAP